jgi:hypothetical protein
MWDGLPQSENIVKYVKRLGADAVNISGADAIK